MNHKVRSQESGVRSQKEFGNAESPFSASNLKPETSNNAKPLASISLDLDDKWSYLKTHGDPGWEKFPSYIETFIPEVLDFFDKLNLQITFFIVGQDLTLGKNRDILQELTKRGHEVANHSFHHEPWLHLYTKDRIEKEVLDTEEQIHRLTGHRPLGFRGPGFSWSLDLLSVLAENGYLYDASTFPTYLGPIARSYYFLKSNLTEEQRLERKHLFGTLKSGKQPVKPYFWELPSKQKLLEIPVTTIPLMKLPFHVSYLLYLSSFSKVLMYLYLNFALTLCRQTNTEPSFLLHPLDFLDSKEAPELLFFPGMTTNKYDKRLLVEQIINSIAKHHRLVSMNTHARTIMANGNITSFQLG